MARPFSLRPLALTTGMAAFSLLTLAACDTPQNNFNPMSDAALRIDTLYWLIIIAATLVGLGVLAALGYILVKFRARPGVEAQQIHGSTPLEIVWTIIPIIVLVVIAIPTVIAIAGAAREPDDNALHVTAIGHQWWFEFHYPGLGPNGEDLITSNEMYLPVGRQVSISLEAEDVIHSFWVPKLLGKLDMIPNRVNRMEPFTPTDIGTFYGQCAEFCGLGHAQMRFRVHVVSEGEFDQWANAMNTPPADPVPGTPAERGEEVFMQVGGCGACHAIQGTGAEGRVGPDLTLFGERTTVGAGILPNTDANLRNWIRDVRSVKALPTPAEMPQTMPAFDWMDEQQLADLSAYLRSLRIP